MEGNDSMTTHVMTKDEKSAVGLYAVLAYDIMDFLDMLREEHSDEALIHLYKMLTPPTDSRHEDRSQLGEGPVFRDLQRRGVDPRPLYGLQYAGFTVCEIHEIR